MSVTKLLTLEGNIFNSSLENSTLKSNIKDTRFISVSWFAMKD
ncbi:hypothetical protein [Vibrio gallaecicus]|nr:hypothetical protein [Vibrio gallaecicus]MDN3614077.1 hypothetical protein [Vibrio gallaecicus]